MHLFYDCKLSRFIQTNKQKKSLTLDHQRSQVVIKKHKLSRLTSHTSAQGVVFLLAASSSLSSSESFSSSHLIRCSISRLNFFTAFGPPSTTTIFTSLQRTAQPVNKTTIRLNSLLVKNKRSLQEGVGALIIQHNVYI